MLDLLMSTFNLFTAFLTISFGDCGWSSSGSPGAACPRRGCELLRRGALSNFINASTSSYSSRLEIFTRLPVDCRSLYCTFAFGDRSLLLIRKLCLNVAPPSFLLVLLLASPLDAALAPYLYMRGASLAYFWCYPATCSLSEAGRMSSI